MFIAMNRFRVKKGSEEDFERVWLTRDSQLATVPGFVEFHLLKGPEAEDHTLYSAHSLWRDREAGGNKPLYTGHPQFEGFEIRQTVRSDRATAA